MSHAVWSEVDGCIVGIWLNERDIQQVLDGLSLALYRHSCSAEDESLNL